MPRLRFFMVAFLALTLAGNSNQIGRSEGQSATPVREITRAITVEKSNASDDHTCVIYALSDMGYDEKLGQWIAETIPEMIEAKSWQQSGGAGVLRYYAPKNILIVNQSAAIHARVAGFLKNLKTSMPRANHSATRKSTHPDIVRAQYDAPTVARTSNPLPEASPYPVPAPVKAPKHLFHFLIRYEGEGIIDDNVVKFMKVQSQPNTVKEAGGGYASPGVPPANAANTSTAATVCPSTATSPAPVGASAPAMSPASLPPTTQDNQKTDNPKESSIKSTR